MAAASVGETTSGGNSAAAVCLRHLRMRHPLPVDYTIDAVFETSAAGGRRLMNALTNGVREFVLCASDGSCTTRVRLRSTRGGTTQHEIGGTPIVVDWAQGTLEREELRVSLSRTELRLFAVLLDAGERPTSRSELIGRVWPRDEMPSSEREDALAVYVCSLRKRLGVLGIESAILTVQAYGYRMRGG